MATHLVRYAHAGRRRWGVVLGAGIAPLDGDYATTAALIEAGEPDWRAAITRAPSIDVAAVTLLSPVTAPARVICQGANYRQHMIESGVDPDEKRFNMFFEKSDASISAPVGSIVRPPSALARIDPVALAKNGPPPSGVKRRARQEWSARSWRDRRGARAREKWSTAAGARARC
jgi:hypothetical protein